MYRVLEQTVKQGAEMREILFRGKRKGDNKWVYGSFARYNLEDGTADMFLPEYGVLFSVHIETLGQFTGLTANGTKIFEGDIVRHHNDNPYGDVEKGQVYWDEISCGWRRTSNGAFHHGTIDTYRMSPTCVYEIIGNIHDNPELMEVK